MEYRVLICPSKPLKERVKVSHVIVECRVIDHHPFIQNVYLTIYRQKLRWSRYMTIQL